MARIQIYIFLFKLRNYIMDWMTMTRKSGIVNWIKHVITIYNIIPLLKMEGVDQF